MGARLQSMRYSGYSVGGPVVGTVATKKKRNVVSSKTKSKSRERALEAKGQERFSNLFGGLEYSSDDEDDDSLEMKISNDKGDEK